MPRDGCRLLCWAAKPPEYDMKKWFAGVCLCLLPLLAHTARAEDEMIDPSDYICAEFVALASTQAEPPLFQGLQIDGFVSSNMGKATVDPRLIMTLMTTTYAMCQKDPTAVVADLWQDLRKEMPDPQDEKWRADATTCRQYNENPTDGDGFVVWLDGYNRHYNVTNKSVLSSPKRGDAFVEYCKTHPDTLMIDALQEVLGNK